MLFLIIFILLLIIIIIKLINEKKEGFENVNEITNESLNPSFIQSYKQFVNFYNPFLKNWEKAIITAASQEVQQPPLENPQQQSTSKPPTISRIEQNVYISNLSSRLNKSLPFITDTLPTEINNKSIPILLNTIPKDNESYQHAMDWMNSQLEGSQQNLQNALKGMPITIETFQSKCGNVSQCLLDDQEFISKVGEQLELSEKKKQEEIQNELKKRMDFVNQNNKLQETAVKNQELIKQSDKVKQQAESGELYKQVNVGDRDIPKPIIPSGGLALSNLEKENPQEYNKLKESNKQMFSLKQLIEQINQNI